MVRKLCLAGLALLVALGCSAGKKATNSCITDSDCDQHSACYSGQCFPLTNHEGEIEVSPDLYEIVQEEFQPEPHLEFEYKPEESEPKEEVKEEFQPEETEVYVPEETREEVQPEPYEEVEPYKEEEVNDEPDTPYVPETEVQDESTEGGLEEAVESEYDPEVSNEYTDSTDEYSPENIGEEYTGEITDLCAPVAKACGDDYRWKETDVDLPDPSYVGKCKPLEIVVDFDGYFDICLDFGNSSEVDSGCYASWTDGSAYHIPGHPTGSHANCGRNIVKWKYAFDVPTCEANGGIETTKPYRKRTFGTSDEGIMCITIEDEEGTSAYDELSYKILKN